MGHTKYVVYNCYKQ